jgi:hypothetical protein
MARKGGFPGIFAVSLAEPKSVFLDYVRLVND